VETVTTRSDPDLTISEYKVKAVFSVVDDNGAPQEVIIPWEEFCRIEKELGPDLDDQAESRVYVSYIGPRGDIYKK